jgi:D-aminoacyl-tRNA deacylase
VIALVQRVTEAAVSVGGETVGEIGAGVLALIGVERGDGEAEAARLAERVLGYRLFADAHGKMNLSLRDTGGGLLAVPQFTLAADTDSGLRASFSKAAAPGDGELLFLKFVEKAGEIHPRVASGRFGAHMRVKLVNDGPVTFWLRVAPRSAS